MEKVVIHPKTPLPVFLTPKTTIKKNGLQMPGPFPFPFSNLLSLIFSNHYLMLPIKQSNPFWGF